MSRPLPLSFETTLRKLLGQNRGCRIFWYQFQVLIRSLPVRGKTHDDFECNFVTWHFWVVFHCLDFFRESKATVFPVARHVCRNFAATDFGRLCVHLTGNTRSATSVEGVVKCNF